MALNYRAYKVLDYMPSEWSYDIAVTVTLKQLHRKLDAEGQYDKTKSKILELLRCCKATIVAELTTNYDIHYHAIVSIPNRSLRNKEPLRWLKDRFRSDFGFTCIKQVDDYHGWVGYLMKDIVETRKVVEPILRDDYEVYN